MIIDNAGLDPEALGGNAAMVVCAGNDIARDSARSLARIGVNVVVADTDGAAGVRTVELIKKEGGDAAPANIGIDVQGKIDLNFLYPEVIKNCGKIDLLVIDGRCLGVDKFLADMVERRYGVIAVVGEPELASPLRETLVRQSGDDGNASVFSFNTSGCLDTEIAAAGLVGAIRFGREFHGQDIRIISGLAKIKLDNEGRSLSTKENTIELSQFQPGSKAAIAQALEKTMEAVAEEYEQLSIMVRPVAKRIFLQGTGMKTEEWRNYAAQIRHALTEGGKNENNAREYLDRLYKLHDFFAAQEVETQGWVKNQENLVTVVDTLAYRKQIVADLITLLKHS